MQLGEFIVEFAILPFLFPLPPVKSEFGRALIHGAAPRPRLRRSRRQPTGP